MQSETPSRAAATNREKLRTCIIFSIKMIVRPAKNTPNISKHGKRCGSPKKNANPHIEEITRVVQTLFEDLELEFREAEESGTDRRKNEKAKDTEGGSVDKDNTNGFDNYGIAENDRCKEETPTKKKKKNRRRAGKKKTKYSTANSPLVDAQLVSLNEAKRRQVEDYLEEGDMKARRETDAIQPGSGDNISWNVDNEIGATKSILELSLNEKDKLKSILREITVDSRLESRRRSIMTSRLKTAVEIEIEKIQEGHECNQSDGCNSEAIANMWRKRDQMLDLYARLIEQREKDRLGIRKFAERELAYVDQTIFACKKRIEEQTEMSKIRLAHAVADANSCMRSLMAFQGHGRGMERNMAIPAASVIQLDSDMLSRPLSRLSPSFITSLANAAEYPKETMNSTEDIRERATNIIQILLEAETRREFHNNAIKECDVNARVDPRERAIYFSRINFELKEAIDKVITQNVARGPVPSHDALAVLQLELHYQSKKDEYDAAYRERAYEREEIRKIATAELEKAKDIIRRNKVVLRDLLATVGITI
ncbi:hypothetical protein BJ508DRAFT_313954 [Ascobolus immersus RN42]|uniref:Uncharacterized protein n=1 Tax=Ascobolus immersus RN42 TaxID=1160509 RepID=A0A3N4HN40_ASCIM|nr:hypothetical protein BJ508DRAFT_313954 [Ascobolus immersus RN42]